MEGPQDPESGVRSGGDGRTPFPLRPAPLSLLGSERRLRGAGELDTRMAGAMGAGPWARES